MAQQTLPPPPNTLLLPEADRDAVWRGWFNQLFVRASSPGQIVHNDLDGLQGGTTDQYYHLTAAQHSTVTSFGSFTNNRVLITNAVSSVTVHGGLAYSEATGQLSVSTQASSAGILIGGDTQLYRDGADTLRTPDSFQADTRLFVGDTSSAATAIRVGATSPQTIGTTQIGISVAALFGTDATAGIRGVQTGIVYPAGITITESNMFVAFNPSGGSGTTITTERGFLCANLTRGSTIVGFQSNVNSGTGKWGFLANGTANNGFNGNVAIGQVASPPTVELDVTGSQKLSGGIAIGTRSVVSSYTAVEADFTVLANASGAAFTVTLPHASTFPNKIYAIKKIDSSGNAVTVSSVSNIDGATTTSLAAQFTKIMLQSNTAQWWEI